MSDPAVDHDSKEWEEARKRVNERRDFGGHLAAYLVVNGFFVLMWALSGAGYFWPAWIIGGWGIGVVMHWWNSFVRRPVTEADIEAELARGRR